MSHSFLTNFSNERKFWNGLAIILVCDIWWGFVIDVEDAGCLKVVKYARRRKRLIIDGSQGEMTDRIKKFARHDGLEEVHLYSGNQSWKSY